MLYIDNITSEKTGKYALRLTGDEIHEVSPLFRDLPIDRGYDYIDFKVTSFADICDILVDYELSSNTKQTLKRIRETKPPIMEANLNFITPKFKLNPHKYQMDAVKFGLDHPRFLLGDVMGSGKSGSSIFLAEILKAIYGFKHVLVICGVNGAKFNWHQVEIPKFSYEKSHIIGGRVNRNGNFVIGTLEERIADLEAPHDEFYLITNIESLRDETFTETLKTLTVEGKIGMVIIDEVHKISGRTSAQGKAIHKIRPKYRVGLTGTPVYNKPFDLYNIMKWLGYEYMNFEDFRLVYATEVPRTMTVKGKMVKFFDYVYKDLSMLHERLKEFMLRRGAEILNLPEPIFKDEYVELDKDQLKLYNKLKEDVIKSTSYSSLVNIDELLANPSIEFIKARQAVACPHIFGVKHDAKLERTIELLEEAFENGQSVVIFGWFNETIYQYEKVLQDKFGDSVLAVTPKTKNAQDIITQFQSETKPMALIGSIGKLGTSFTVTRASIVIFADTHVIYSDYKQAYYRVWRQGQKNTVLIINLLAKDTMDERLQDLIHFGKSKQDQIVDGKDSDEYLIKKYGKIEDYL